MIFALVGSAVAYGVHELTRERPGPAVLMDWDHVRTIGKERLRLDPYTQKDLDKQSAIYQKDMSMISESIETHLGPAPKEFKYPHVEALSRSQWLDLNLDMIEGSMGKIINDLSWIPNSHLISIQRFGLDHYISRLLVFLGDRVLGQFDPHLMGRKRIGNKGLYMVEANITRWQDTASLPGKELRHWLLAHEATHAWQFYGHPWMAPYLDGLLEETIASINLKDKSPISLFMNIKSSALPMQKAQALMTLVEGYANLAMNKVGADILPNHEALLASYRDRSGTRDIFAELIWRLGGLDAKRKQYTQGETFCLEVLKRTDMKVLNLAWQSPKMLPTLEEIQGDVATWIKRAKKAS